MHFNYKIFYSLFFALSILGNTFNVTYAEEIPKDMQSKAENVAKKAEELKHSESFMALQRKIQLQQQEMLNKAMKLEYKNLASPFSAFATSSENTWLFIFISSSMPEDSVKNYVKAAKKTGALLVLNGLIENDLPKTLKTVAQWGEEENYFENFIIDPVVYERFAIQQVPAIVLTQAEYPCAGNTECSISFIDKISGDVTLDFALREFIKKGDLKANAQKYLTLLGEFKNE